MNRTELAEKSRTAKRVDTAIMLTGIVLLFLLFGHIGLHDEEILAHVADDPAWLRRIKLITVLVLPIVPLLVAHLVAKTYLKKRNLVCAYCKRPIRAKVIENFIMTGHCPYCGKQNFSD